MNRVCLLNDWPERSRYAFELLRELPKLGVPVEMSRFAYEEQVPEHSRQRVIQAPCHFPILNRTLNWFFCLPGVVPPGFALYHATNQNLARTLSAAQGARVLTIHDLTAFQPGGAPEATRLLVRIGLRKIQEFDRVIAVSAHVKREIERILEYPSEKIDVTLQGVDRSVFKPGPKQDARKHLGLPLSKKIVLHVGNDLPRKNFDGVIRALASPIRGENILLTHVGPVSSQNRRLIHDLGMDSSTRLAPPAPDLELAQYYRAADVLVFPSFYEGFGLPVLEAMASGTPVVCSNTTSLPEVAGNSALTVNPNSIASITEAIEKVLFEPRTARRLVTAGLRRAKEFTWKRCAEETVKSYRKTGWRP